MDRRVWLAERRAAVVAAYGAEAPGEGIGIGFTHDGESFRILV